MKRWAFFTVFLYALALILLTVPVGVLAFGSWSGNGRSMELREIISCYANWGYWAWLGVLLAGQALLLLLPIHIAERRLPARRPLKTPIVVTAFFLANLCVAGLVSLLCAIFRDDGLEWLDHVNPVSPGAGGGWHFFFSFALTVSIFWAVWGLVFNRYAKSDDESALLARLTRWLLRGSILELIVAVPSHVIVRRRDDCCAPAGTFWGIATGISVMLLCFGPGVYFLFVKRMRQLQPKASPPEK